MEGGTACRPPTTRVGSHERGAQLLVLCLWLPPCFRRGDRVLGEVAVEEEWDFFGGREVSVKEGRDCL